MIDESEPQHREGILYFVSSHSLVSTLWLHMDVYYVDRWCVGGWCIDRWCVDEWCMDGWCVGGWCVDVLCMDGWCMDGWCVDRRSVDEWCVDRRCVDGWCQITRKIKAFKFLPMVISLKPTILTTTYASSCSLSTVLNVASSLQQTQHILSIDRLIIHSPPPLPDPSLNPQSISFLLNSSSPLSLRLHSGDTLVASQHHESP